MGCFVWRPSQKGSGKEIESNRPIDTFNNRGFLSRILLPDASANTILSRLQHEQSSRGRGLDACDRALRSRRISSPVRKHAVPLRVRSGACKRGGWKENGRAFLSGRSSYISLRDSVLPASRPARWSFCSHIHARGRNHADPSYQIDNRNSARRARSDPLLPFERL